MSDISRYREAIDRNLAAFRLAKQQVKAEEEWLDKAKQEVEDSIEAQKILQSAAETIQSNACIQIARVVSRCLEAVFGEEAYEFRIDFKQARGKTEATFLFVRDGLELEDPLESAGGGVVDVSSFALRLAALVLTRPRRRRFLALDEPFKHLSLGYRPNVRQLLEVLTKEMDLQILMVTHSDEFAIGKVVEIE